MNVMTLPFRPTEFEIRSLAVLGRARYLSVMEAPQNFESSRVGGEETFVSLKPECQSGVRTRTAERPYTSTISSANTGRQ